MKTFASENEALQHLADLTGKKIVIGKVKNEDLLPETVWSRLPAQKRNLFKKQSEGESLTQQEQKEIEEAEEGLQNV